MAGMALVFLAPPVLAVLSRGAPQPVGAAAGAMMALAFAPTLRVYGRPAAAGLALPAIAAAYMLTVQSAAEFWAGRGGLWKGRVQTRLKKAERA